MYYLELLSSHLLSLEKIVLGPNPIHEQEVVDIQNQIVQTQEKVTTLLTEIEEATEQYFLLKQRYDALDIEYAQLYEKFSEAEAAAGREVSH